MFQILFFICTISAIYDIDQIFKNEAICRNNIISEYHAELNILNKYYAQYDSKNEYNQKNHNTRKLNKLKQEINNTELNPIINIIKTIKKRSKHQ